MCRRFVLGLFAIAAWMPGVSASNGNLPRTPVIHQNETCITIIDPATTPVLHLPYTIPFNDTCIGADELPDNRTHQLIAWCRTWPAWEQRPHWLTWSDVDRAVEHGILPQAPPATDVVEGQPELEGCMVRIDADQERRAIHCATAVDGVDWDVSTAAAGAYVVHGYTFDPPQNLWVARRGVVKIEGAGDPPAAALSAHATLLGNDAPLALEACTDAPAGSTLRAYWARAAGSEWYPFAEIVDIDHGFFALELPIPEELADSGGVIVLRVEIAAPDGSTFVYDSPDEVTVIAAPVSTTGATSSPAFDFCADNPDALEPQACGDDDDGSSKVGCGCNSGGPLPLFALLFAAPLRGRYTRGRGPRCTIDDTRRTVAARRSR
jgi:hypothetical protein